MTDRQIKKMIDNYPNQAVYWLIVPYTAEHLLESLGYLLFSRLPPEDQTADLLYCIDCIDRERITDALSEVGITFTEIDTTSQKEKEP